MLAPCGHPATPPARSLGGMMARKSRMVVLNGKYAGHVHKEAPPLRRRVSMALKGSARTPLGLLPGSCADMNVGYSNMAATKKKHVLDQDRRMQNTPLGFVVEREREKFYYK